MHHCIVFPSQLRDLSSLVRQFVPWALQIYWVWIQVPYAPLHRVPITVAGPEQS
ncbi:hypothetical protein J6590_101194, partial [Homalodisca vitripennis]